MSPKDFAAKVEWEGGILEALDCGLSYKDLDPNDPDSFELRRAWSSLEGAFEEMQFGLRDLEEIFEELEDDKS